MSRTNLPLGSGRGSGNGYGSGPGDGNSAGHSNNSNGPLLHKTLRAPVLNDDRYQFAIFPPSPPSTGTGSLLVQTNHFSVKSVPTKLFTYLVTFEKQNPGSTTAQGQDVRKSEKRQIFKTLRTHAPLNDASIPWATDYEATIWSVKELPVNNGQIRIRNIGYRQQNGRPITLSSVIIRQSTTLQFTNPPRPGELTGPDGQAKSNALNAIISHHVSESDNTNGQVMHVTANKFYYKYGYRRMSALHAFRGYFSSLRPGSHHLLLNVNTITTAFHEPLLVSELFDQLTGTGKGYSMEELKNALMHLRVRITYSRGLNDGKNQDEEQNRMKTIAGFGLVPGEQMVQIGSVRKTVTKHFSQDKNITVRRPGSPCVNVGRPLPRSRPGQVSGDMSGNDTNPQAGAGQIWIPAEFLEIDLYQPFRGTMSSKHVTEMIDIALRHPAANARLIVEEGLGLMGINPAQQQLADFNVIIDKNMLQIPAVFLHAPKIRYGPKNDQKVLLADWNLFKVKFFKPASDTKAGILDFCRMPSDCDYIVCELNGEFTKLGMQTVRLSTERCQHIPGGLQKDDVALVDHINALLRGKWNVPICLVILPEMSKSDYAKVKRVLDICFGVHSICVTHGKIQNSMRQGEGGRSGFFANLALKFNFKLGGVNHLVVSQQQAKTIGNQKRNLVVLGADVVHPPQSAVAGAPSVAAVVGNSDPEIANFPGSMRLNPGGQEIIRDLRSMVKERLAAYVNVNQGKLWPGAILFYRDGVSETQYEEVRQKELPQIKDAISDLYEVFHKRIPSATKDIPVIFIIVTKRHHVRFYPMTSKDTYEEKNKSRGKPLQTNTTGSTSGGTYNGNLRPGLLVTQGVTQPANNKELGECDFYLQSHKALQGSARSAHYTVILNEPKESLAWLAEMTNLLCYNYARATKGVSYCGPAYYADRLCDRGYHYLRDWFVPNSPDQNRIWMPPQETGETDDGFKARAALQLQAHPSWQKRDDRLNPWHPKLDNVMFYL